MILYRLKQPDFVTTKTNSFRNLLRYITEKREINIVDHVMTFQHLKENEKEEKFNPSFDQFSQITSSIQTKSTSELQLDLPPDEEESKEEQRQKKEEAFNPSFDQFSQIITGKPVQSTSELHKSEARRVGEECRSRRSPYNT